MALTPDQIEEARALLGAAPTLRAAAASLREQLPGIRASVVDAFDMRGETPGVQVGARSLYLMSTDGHCWNVTSDPAAASALVLTEA